MIILVAVVIACLTIETAVVRWQRRRQAADRDADTRALDVDSTEPTDTDWARVERYAAGGRRLLLLTTQPLPARQWHREVHQLEQLVDAALAMLPAGGHAARDLRAQGGARDSFHVLTWDIPGPHAATVIAEVQRCIPTAWLREIRGGVVILANPAAHLLVAADR